MVIIKKINTEPKETLHSKQIIYLIIDVKKDFKKNKSWYSDSESFLNRTIKLILK